MTGLDDTLGPRLAQLDANHLRRSLKTISSGPGPRIWIGGREVVQLCSNDYLGLAADPRLQRAAADAVARLGCGAGSSRLVSGTMDSHADLERALAELKMADASLVFASGYHANIGVVSALMGSGDTIFSDQRNHASLIDGCRLSRASTKVYRHVDPEHLGQLLSAAPTAGQKLIVTETVFSMDGDVAPLRDLVGLARHWGAWILVDEAHATGVFGEHGGGVVQESGLAAEVDVQVGTLGKALGSLGAFTAGGRLLVDWLTNAARTFVYSTALPPAAVAAARVAVDVVRGEPERRQRLWDHATMMRSRLTDCGFRLGPTCSPILPLLVGDDARALKLSAELFKRGVFVPAIRPPTVPPGTSRLRVVPTATHSTEDIETALEAFADAGRVSGVLR